MLKYIRKILYLLSRPKNMVAVIIPIYRDTLTSFEKISLDQCLRVFNQYPIFIIAPERLNPELGEGDNIQRVKFEYFNKYYFINKESYNKLMLSSELYERFFRYKFLLIHQLDVFVFEDQLNYWCAKNYDYIGAPWMDLDDLKPELYWKGWYYRLKEKLGKPLDFSEPRVGNGGFSLRKVRAHLLALYILHSKTRLWTSNEDVFWAGYAPGHNPLFKIAPLEEAFQFSFETKPEMCFRENGHRLPFGCHAWGAQNFSFWRPFIEEFGYSLGD